LANREETVVTEAAVRLAFFGAILKAMLTPALELILTILGWVTALVPASIFIRAFRQGPGPDTEADWGVTNTVAVTWAILPAALQLFLRERRQWAGQQGRRLFYFWTLGGPGLAAGMVSAAAGSILLEPAVIGWCAAAGVLAARIFRRLVLLVADGIGGGWTATMLTATALLSGALYWQAVIAAGEWSVLHAEFVELKAKVKDRLRKEHELKDGGEAPINRVEVDRLQVHEAAVEAGVQSWETSAGAGEFITLAAWSVWGGGAIIIAIAVTAGAAAAAIVGVIDLPPSVKPTLLLGVTFAGQGC
jgi:hypothetical protein